MADKLAATEAVLDSIRFDMAKNHLEPDTAKSIWILGLHTMKTLSLFHSISAQIDACTRAAMQPQPKAEAAENGNAAKS